jgi:hypothetical protein
MRIIGHAFLIVYLYITACALLYTVIRASIFTTFPQRIILYSYGMTAPYQSASAPHGQLVAECLQEESWTVIDLAPFYPQMFGERNAREYFAVYAYSGKEEDRVIQRERYAGILQRLLVGQGTTCSKIRLSWDKWPAMTGPFDALHQPVFTERLPLYTSNEE